MMQAIQIARLEGFFHVARTGGYAKAARAFPYPITQPAVHQQVRKLEGELGVKLFQRTARDRMELTPAGRALHACVAPFMESLPDVVRSVRDGTFGGRLTIHAASLVIRRLLPGWFQRLKLARPDIAVDLHEAEEPALSLLRSGGTDIVVDFVPQVPSDVTVTRVATTFGFAVAPAGHPVAARRRWRLEDLRGETFISYSRALAPHELQMSVLREHGIVPPRVISLGSAESILGFVEAGLGWSLVPWLDPKGPSSPHITTCPLRGARSRFPVHAAFRRHDANNPLIVAALAAARP